MRRRIRAGVHFKYDPALLKRASPRLAVRSFSAGFHCRMMEMFMRLLVLPRERQWPRWLGVLHMVACGLVATVSIILSAALIRLPDSLVLRLLSDRDEEVPDEVSSARRGERAMIRVIKMLAPAPYREAVASDLMERTDELYRTKLSRTRVYARLCYEAVFAIEARLTVVGARLRRRLRG